MLMSDGKKKFYIICGNQKEIKLEEVLWCPEQCLLGNQGFPVDSTHTFHLIKYCCWPHIPLYGSSIPNMTVASSSGVITRPWKERSGKSWEPWRSPLNFPFVQEKQFFWIHTSSFTGLLWCTSDNFVCDDDLTTLSAVLWRQSLMGQNSFGGRSETDTI